MSSSSSPLSERIRLLKGRRTSADIVKNADVSRETFRKIERGESVKLSTIKKIANYLGATPEQWRQLVIAWIKLEIGPDEARFIQFSQDAVATSKKKQDAENIHELASHLEPEERKQIILAMTIPEVRRCLPALTTLYETVKRAGK